MISQFAVEKFVNKGIERTNMSDNKKDKQAKVIPSQSQEVSFKDVKEFLNYFSTVVL